MERRGGGDEKWDGLTKKEPKISGMPSSRQCRVARKKSEI